MKKIPMRTCVVTHEKLPKKDLIRLVVVDDEILVDETGKVNGHGCYIKKSIDALNIQKDKKIIDKVLEKEITNDIYEKIEEIINK